MNSQSSYEELLKIISPFLSNYLISYLLIFIFFMTGYFGIISSTLNNYSPIKIKMLLILGFRTAIPKGFILLILIFFIGSISNAIFPPLILLFVISIIAPVILVTENQGVFSSLKSALFLKYAQNSEIGSLRSFFLLSGIIGFYYIFFILYSILTMNITLPPHILPEFLWQQNIGPFPFSFIKLIEIIFSNLFFAFIFSSLPVVTARYYNEVRSRISNKV